MATKAKNVEFDNVVTTVDFDTDKNTVTCVKTFYKGGKEFHSDVMVYDLRIITLPVALQMASAYVQICTLTEYE